MFHERIKTDGNSAQLLYITQNTAFSWKLLMVFIYHKYDQARKGKEQCGQCIKTVKPWQGQVLRWPEVVGEVIANTKRCRKRKGQIPV